MEAKKRNKNPEQLKRQNQIVDSIRQMLARNMSKGDIKRAISVSFGLSARSVERYLSAAKVRNCEVIDRTPDECLADSISYWGRKQQTAEGTIIRETKSRDAAIAKIEMLQEEIDSPHTLQERREAAVEDMERQLRIVEHCRKALYSAETRSMECQDRIDRLLATARPNKVAVTKVDGTDTEWKPVIREPMTMADADRNIQHLLGVLKQRVEAIENGMPEDEARQLYK